MTDRTGADRPITAAMHRRLNDALLTPGGRFRLGFVVAIVILGVAIGGHIYGRVLAARDMAERDTTILQLHAESQRLQAQINSQGVELATLQAKQKDTQATLDAIVPAENTYSFNPNQSLIVADGHLTIGLIGSPANQNINININGKTQSVVAGEIIKIAPDPTTNCQVTIQSFDMFKAVLNASCAAAKPQ